MFILDTDAITHDQNAQPVIRAKVASTLRESLFTTSVTVEELLRGRLAFINKHRNDPVRIARGHRYLIATLEYLNRWSILRFEERDAAVFGRLHKDHPRVGSQDLRIAAIALRHGFTVVTSNVRDFAQVPKLRIEDWTISA